MTVVLRKQSSVFDPPVQPAEPHRPGPNDGGGCWCGGWGCSRDDQRKPCLQFTGLSFPCVTDLFFIRLMCFAFLLLASCFLDTSGDLGVLLMCHDFLKRQLMWNSDRTTRWIQSIVFWQSNSPTQIQENCYLSRAESRHYGWFGSLTLSQTLWHHWCSCVQHVDGLSMMSKFNFQPSQMQLWLECLSVHRLLAM